MITSELQAFIDSGLYNESNRDLCYKFVAEVKWSGDSYYCKSKECSGGKSKSTAYTIPKKCKIPYSRKCCRCKNIESPTANTSLAGINYLPAFFQMVYLITKHQRDINCRICNEEISKKLKDDGNQISKSTIEKNRILIQNYLIDWNRDYKDCIRSYGLEKYSIGNGKKRKWVYVLCQFSFPRQISSRIYNKDNYDTLKNFLSGTVYGDAEVVLYDWGKEYPTLTQKYPNLKFHNEKLELRNYVTEIKDSIKNWLNEIKIKDLARGNLHIRECIHILYNAYFTPVQLLKLMIGIDVQKVRKR